MKESSDRGPKKNQMVQTNIHFKPKYGPATSLANFFAKKSPSFPNINKSPKQPNDKQINEDLYTSNELNSTKNSYISGTRLHNNKSLSISITNANLSTETNQVGIFDKSVNDQNIRRKHREKKISFPSLNHKEEKPHSKDSLNDTSFDRNSKEFLSKGTRKPKALKTYILKNKRLCKIVLAPLGQKEVLDKNLFSDSETNHIPLSKKSFLLEEIVINILKAVIAFKNKKKDVCYQTLQTLIDISQESKFLKVYLLILEFCSKIYREFADLEKYELMLYIYKECCDNFEDFVNKVRAYKWISQAKMETKDFERASKYIKRMLVYSWAFNMRDYELGAYDFLGKYYFYIGDMSQALYFHEKMIKDDVEKEGSYAKKVGLSFVEYKLKLLRSLKGIRMLLNSKIDEGWSSEEDVEIPFKRVDLSVELIKQRLQGIEEKEKRKFTGVKPKIGAAEAPFYENKYEKFREQAVILSRLRTLHNEKSSEIEVMRDMKPKSMEQENLMYRDKIAKSLLNPPIYNHLSSNRLMTQYHLYSKYKSIKKDYNKEESLGHLMSKKTRIKILHLFHKYKSYFEQQHEALQNLATQTSHIQVIERENLENETPGLPSANSKKSGSHLSLKKISQEDIDIDDYESSERYQEDKNSSVKRLGETMRSRKSTYISSKTNIEL